MIIENVHRGADEAVWCSWHWGVVWVRRDVSVDAGCGGWDSHIVGQKLVAEN